MQLSPKLQLWRIDKLWRFHRSVVLGSVLIEESGLWARVRSGWVRREPDHSSLFRRSHPRRRGSCDGRGP